MAEGPVQVTGGGERDVKALERTMRMRRGGLRDCYQKALVSDPTLKGKVTVKWTVNGAGRVEDVTAEGDVSEVVHACLVRKIKRLRFPKPKGALSVSYPFTFKPDP